MRCLGPWLLFFCLAWPGWTVSVRGAEAPADSQTPYDLVIRGARIYDGRGGAPFVGDMAVRGDSIAEVASSLDGRGEVEIDARGLAAAPGFINMLSWATESLLEDGRAQSDIRQGVTLEVLGEGRSMGPLNEAMQKDMRAQQGSIKYDVPWRTLGQYLDHLADRGISPNVASFVGATTVRLHVLGGQKRAPTRKELDQMRELVREAMTEGAMGLGSALQYAPAVYAGVEEIVALAQVVSGHDGLYISHIRNEGSRLLEAVEELIRVARVANVRAEIYHLKAAGPENWNKMEAVIRRIEEARGEGLAITANMYPYTASSSSLDVLLPGWVHAGGRRPFLNRLGDPSVRRRIQREIRVREPEKIFPLNFRNEAHKALSGRSLAEIAALGKKTSEEALMDLVLREEGGVRMLRVTVSEENLRRQIALPWVSFGSDGGAYAPESVFLQFQAHPRAYGTFARLLGRYVREERIIPLEEAIRKLTSLPAANLKLERRGGLVPGHFADIVLFDPDRIQDHATIEEPHQYATGVVHVFVNGVQVLRDGEHTGAKPGRVIRGPGWAGRKKSPGSS